MKRLQIMIEEDMDAALANEARREGSSKAAIIRRLVREHLELPLVKKDPVTTLIGTADFASEHHDDVAYR